ncbi:hypothetical protein L2725_20080 [Shewanella corallii]|uniref:HTH CENPB-type domain-containing protein n=1 Tax=Shewanella corallii TaxID=560080 RepID=A0ABT0NC47_9GAMM|nr:hypothetical protein [Shewanella corallii]MCL2916043.1 hypothetical protein [Shewanella corallii]
MSAVTVSAFELSSLDEVTMDWLIKFRRSKCIDTLDMMTDRAERDNQGKHAVLDAINQAWCVREKEIKEGRFV